MTQLLDPGQQAGQDAGPAPGQAGARRLPSRGQAARPVILAGGVAVAVLALGAAGIGPPPLWWAAAAVTVVIVAYLAVVMFGFAGVLAAPRLRPARAARPAGLDGDLPVYTVLVPMHRVGARAEGVITGLSGLDYPADRRQVLLLIPADDTRTTAAVASMTLGPPFEVVLVPPGPPGSTAQACNIGLGRARGEFCVVYHPAGRPEPGQLREAVAALRRLPPWVVCVQAEQRCANPDSTWLTQFSAAELAANFSLFLRGVALPAPVGSTSAHFRVEALGRLGGWAEDIATPGVDLGVRIPRRGWDVRMLASATTDEADTRLSPWLHQRSRWVQGCGQTWLAHMRSPYRLWRDLGPRRFTGLQLTLALPVLTALVNPLLWALTVVFLLRGPAHGATSFPGAVLSLAVAAAALGALLTVYALMLGCMEHGLFRAVRTMLLAPVYSALLSVAAYRAVAALLRPRPRRHQEPAARGLASETSVLPS